MYSSIQPYVLKIRRELHSIPEVGLDLPESQSVIIRELKAMGIPFLKSSLDSSIMAYITGANSGKTVALRADFDALPITEETNVEYASKNHGAMHACGHDAHAAMLLGAAKLLMAQKDSMSGRVILIFQAGEETGHGAKQFVTQGFMEKPYRIDAIFGIHIGTIFGEDVKTGSFSVLSGPLMSGADIFDINIFGKGTHGSKPDGGIDPISIASHIVVNLHQLNAREISPLDSVSLTIGMLQSGAASNVIPEMARMKGSLRAFDKVLRDRLVVRIQEIVEGTAKIFGGSAEIQFISSIAPVINDPILSRIAAKSISKVCGDECVCTKSVPIMGSEDFSEYQQYVPGVLLVLSSYNEDMEASFPHHSPRFNIDESVLWRGSGAYAAFAMDYLSIE